MRTPKYKAFYKPHNYIYHVTDMNFEGPDYTLREVKLSNGIWLRSDKLDDIILIEQTPFTDKNGKEIYEGDIFIYRYTLDGTQKKIKVVSFDKKVGAWYLGEELLSNVLVEQNDDNWKLSQNYKVNDAQYLISMGNIHKNPELISKTPTHEH